MSYGIKIINDSSGILIDGINSQYVLVSKQTVVLTAFIGGTSTLVASYSGSFYYTREGSSGSTTIAPLVFFSNPRRTMGTAIVTGVASLPLTENTRNGLSFYSTGVILGALSSNPANTSKFEVDAYIFDVINSVATSRLSGAGSHGIEVYSSQVINGTNKAFTTACTPLLISGYGITNGASSFSLSRGSVPSNPAWSIPIIGVGAGTSTFDANSLYLNYGVLPVTSGTTITAGIAYRSGPPPATTYNRYFTNEYLTVINASDYD